MTAGRSVFGGIAVSGLMFVALLLVAIRNEDQFSSIAICGLVFGGIAVDDLIVFESKPVGGVAFGGSVAK